MVQPPILVLHGMETTICDDGIHSLLQPIVKFNMSPSGCFLFCMYEVGQNGTDSVFSVLSDDLHLGPVSFRFMLVQDIQMLLLVSQEAFKVDEGVWYYLHGSLLVQLDGDQLIIFVLPVLIIKGLVRDKTKGWLVTGFATLGLVVFQPLRD